MKNANVYPHRMAPAVHRPAPGAHLCAPQVPARDFVLKEYVDRLIAEVKDSIEGIEGLKSLPPATKDTLGGVIVGDGIHVDGDGRISVSIDTSRLVLWTEASDGTFSALTIGTRQNGAVAPRSMTVGEGDLASGPNSFAGGRNAKASNSMCFSWGEGAESSGHGAIAMGRLTIAFDQRAFAWSGVIPETSGVYYTSHGTGTFNVNPVGGTDGFFVGDKSLTEIIGEGVSGCATREELSAVNKTATDALGIADLARGDIGKVYNLAYQNSEQIKNKRDKADNIAAKDEFTEWRFICDIPEIQAALNENPPVMSYGGYANWVLSKIPLVAGYDRSSEDHMFSQDEDVMSYSFQGIYSKDGNYYGFTATRSISTKSGEPYVTPTGVKNIAIPKYEFVIGRLKHEEDSYFVTLEPYHCTVLNGEDLTWPYFKVEAGGESGKVRDFMLVVDLTGMEDPPTITWPANFHPRTDAETDFACVAGVRNVYWITEHAPGEFCVAGWQETEGGGTSNGGNAQ